MGLPGASVSPTWVARVDPDAQAAPTTVLVPSALVKLTEPDGAVWARETRSARAPTALPTISLPPISPGSLVWIICTVPPSHTRGPLWRRR